MQLRMHRTRNRRAPVMPQPAPPRAATRSTWLLVAHASRRLSRRWPLEARGARCSSPISCHHSTLQQLVYMPPHPHAHTPAARVQRERSHGPPLPPLFTCEVLALLGRYLTEEEPGVGALAASLLAQIRSRGERQPHIIIASFSLHYLQVREHGPRCQRAQILHSTADRYEVVLGIATRSTSGRLSFPPTHRSLCDRCCL